jgi:transposase
MPKLKESEAEEKNRIARAYIAKNMELYGLSDEDVSKKLHVVKRTFQNKKKRPETFTLDELRKLCYVLKFNDQEKVMLL